MSKWVNLSLAAVMVLGTAAMSMADVPSNLTSTVGCACVADAGGGASTALPLKCTISPGGNPNSEDIVITTTVRNVLGAPLSGSSVIVTAVPVNGAQYIWDDGLLPLPVVPPENPQTGTTPLSGIFTAVFDEGGIQHPGGAVPAPVYPNLDMVVTANGPGPGGPITLASCVPQLTVTSYDLDKDGAVGLLDLISFAGQFGVSSIPAICDYDWSNAPDPVGLIALILFASEYNANINNQ